MLSGLFAGEVEGIEIEAERALVSANRELMERMERRIRDGIAQPAQVSRSSTVNPRA